MIVKSFGVSGIVLMAMGFAFSGLVTFLFATDQGRDFRHLVTKEANSLARTARRTVVPRVKEFAREAREVATTVTHRAVGTTEPIEH